MYLFLFSFFIFFYSAVPLIFYEDNPEFITTAFTLGISHPSGYPLINSLGNLAGLIPIGSFAFRCNLLSAFFGASAIYLFYKCAIRLTRDRLLSLSTALTLAFSGNFWSQAVIMEVYTLNHLLFFGICYIALSGKLVDFRWLLLSSFLLGLGVTNHLSFSLGLFLFVPLWLSWKKEWKYTITPKLFALLLSAGLLSWAVQLYLPARSISSSNDIFFSWGRVNSLKLFIGNITGSIYSGSSFNLGTGYERINIFSKYIYEIPTPILIFVIFLFSYGIFRMLKHSRWEGIGILLAVPVFIFYALIQYAALDILLLIPWGLVLLTIAFGLGGLHQRKRSSIGFFTLLIPFFLFIHNFPLNDKHNDYSAYDYTMDVFDSLPKNGALNLSHGFHGNYLYEFVNYGPASLPKSKRNSGQDIFYPYPISNKTPFTNYGLLNSPTFTPTSQQLEAVWKHTRLSFIDDYVGNFRGGYLTRAVFKGAILSRVLMQKGLYLKEIGLKNDANRLLHKAIRLSPQSVMQEASIRYNWGEPKLALDLVKLVMDEQPSTEASILLSKMILDIDRKEKDAKLSD